MRKDEIYDNMKNGLIFFYQIICQKAIYLIPIFKEQFYFLGNKITPKLIVITGYLMKRFRVLGL